MSIGQGSITRTTNSGGNSGGVTIAGARNGVSLDASNFVVLGEDIGAGGLPGKLLSNREIPMQGFIVNWYDGCTVLSTTNASTPVAALLELQCIVAANTDESAQRIMGDTTASGSAVTLLELDAVVPAPAGIGTPGAYMACTINAVQTFFMAYNGQTFWKNSLTGVPYLTISDAVEEVGAVGGQAVLQIEPVYDTSIPAGTFNDLFMRPNFTEAGGSGAVIQIEMVPVINQTAGGTGAITGILFNPTITSITGQLIAYQNSIGDVLLQSNGTTGRTAVHRSSATAWLHVGAGTAAVGGGPLKLTPGPLTTVPEDGLIEYDGTNFFKTIGATRSIIL